jgi:dolichol-phosphate mannosyltransferase
MPSADPELSVVVPVHNESGNVLPLIDESGAAPAPAPTAEFQVAPEAVFVDDCSTDDTLAVLIGAGRAPLAGCRRTPQQLRPERRCTHRRARGAGWRAGPLDTWLRRLSSRIANGVRARLLADATPDAGCGLELFAREDFLVLPYFDQMHRFLPALVRRPGGTVESVAVAHRPRTRGKSHYGIHNRL